MKKISLVLLSGGILFATCFGATSANWAVTDNAEEFGIRITSSRPSKTPGYYLIWNGEETRLGDKTNDELKVTVTVENTGIQSFSIVDESGATINNQASTITLDMAGDYTFCFDADKTYVGGPSENTYVYYTFYFTDSFNWGENNIKCYLYNNSGIVHVNNTWPGNSDYSISFESQNEFGQNVYKVTPNAARYGRNGSMMIMNNNNNNHQSKDIDICNTISPGVTGLYMSDSNMFLPSVDVSAVTWWKDSGHHPVAYYFGGSGPAKYEAMTQVGTTNTFVAPNPVDRNLYSKVIFVTSTITGSGTGWPGGDIWKQTVDIDIPSCEQSCFNLSSTENGGKQTGSWGANVHGFGTFNYVS